MTRNDKATRSSRLLCATVQLYKAVKCKKNALSVIIPTGKHWDAQIQKNMYRFLSSPRTVNSNLRNPAMLWAASIKHGGAVLIAGWPSAAMPASFSPSLQRKKTTFLQQIRRTGVSLKALHEIWGTNFSMPHLHGE